MLPKYFNMSIKKQNLIPISNPLKSIKKVYMKKVKGLRTFDTVLKDEKVHNWYTFMLITFLHQFGYTIFNGFEISIKFCIFC